MGIFLMIVLITFFFGVWFFFFEDDLGALFGFDAGAIQWPFAVVLLLHHSDNHL